MHTQRILTVLITVLGFTASMHGYAAKQNSPLDAYPSTVDGLQRHVIELAAVSHEDERQVEVIIGEKQQVDCNHTSLLGSFSTHTVEGWGYDYYKVEIKPGRISTKMACLHQASQIKFVSLPLSTAQRFIRYNSKLPIVVYAPKGIDVNYRIWQASPEIAAAARK